MTACFKLVFSLIAYFVLCIFKNMLIFHLIDAELDEKINIIIIALR